MPTTRKKVIKTVYKDEGDSAEETGDFSDSGSEAIISEEEPSSDDEEEHEPVASSGDEFVKIKNKTKSSKQRRVPKPKKFAKTFINKITKQSVSAENEDDVTPALFSVKDLTDADKLLPPILNLSESGKFYVVAQPVVIIVLVIILVSYWIFSKLSDSSDDESPKQSSKNTTATSIFSQNQEFDSDDEAKTEYKDVSI